MKTTIASAMKLIRRIIYKLFQEHSALQGYVAHTPHGAFTVFAAVYIHWTIALLFGIGFIIFELNQEKHYWKVGDKACKDLAGWLLGIFIAGIVYSMFWR